MTRAFHLATAEQVIACVEAVVASSNGCDQTYVANFNDLKEDQALAALKLAEDVGFITEQSGKFQISNPISRLLRTPHVNEKAAVLRIMIESFRPFQVFREELEFSNDALIAAKRTRTLLTLDAHWEDIKTTLLNLATFSGALTAGHGGKYERDSKSAPNLLKELADGCSEEGAAVFQIRKQIESDAANMVSHDNVVTPLAAALRHAASGSAREAVVYAGNAVESFLDEYAAKRSASLANATGLNSKIDKLLAANVLSKKLGFNGKYLGHI